jgi:transposase InsO family protein
MAPQSLGATKYYISFRDDATSWTELEPIKKRSDPFGSIKQYSARCEPMHAVKITAIRSDKGGEYTSHAFEEFLACSGCTHEVSAAYSQEQNGVAERVNRTIVGRAKAMLYGVQLPLFLWAEEAKTDVYITNRTPTRSQTKTAYELWTGKPAKSQVHL